MKLTVHPIRAWPGCARPGRNPFKSSLRRSVLPALAPLPQQRRSEGFIPLTCATNARSDIATTSHRHGEGVYASVRSRNSLPARLRWGGFPPQRSRRWPSALRSSKSIENTLVKVKYNDRIIIGGNNFRLTTCTSKLRNTEAIWAN